MYIGDPQRVAAIMLFWRYLAKPKSAVRGEIYGGKERRGNKEQKEAREDKFTFDARGECSCVLKICRSFRKITQKITDGCQKKIHSALNKFVCCRFPVEYSIFKTNKNEHCTLTILDERKTFTFTRFITMKNYHNIVQPLGSYDLVKQNFIMTKFSLQRIRVSHMPCFTNVCHSHHLSFAYWSANIC